MNKNESKPNLLRVFSRFYNVFSAVLIAIAIIWALVGLVLRVNAEMVTGKVVDIAVVQNAIPFTAEDGGLFYYPVIQYQDRNGDIVEYQSAQPVPQNEFTVNDEVPLLLTQGNLVYRNNFWGMFGIPFILFGIAVLFLVFSLVWKKSGNLSTRETTESQ